MKEIVDIKALADLARIEVSESEMEKLQHEIPDILGFVETIQNATTSKKITASTPIQNVMRDDSDPHETGEFTDVLLAAAPKTENGYVAVKQVLSKE